MISKTYENKKKTCKPQLKPHLGPIPRWHHLACFKKVRKELGWKDEYSGSEITFIILVIYKTRFFFYHFVMKKNELKFIFNKFHYNS